ncbi:MAG: hypothetical protein QM687_04310 [Ferruginibacter sp.]
MNRTQPSATVKITVTIAALAAIAAFFLPWVQWADAAVTAKDMATGNFFNITETKFAIANPFPSIVVANAVFWLIPALALIAALWVLLRRSYAGWYAALAGAMILGLATVFLCFTNELKVFNTAIQLPGSLQLGWYLSVAAALALIVLAWPGKLFLKIVLLLLPVAIAYGAFSQIKKSQMSETVDKTADLKADYSLNAETLIKEFVASDSTANAKYRDKILSVSGIISEVSSSDSTATLSFADSTGSYAIFDFEKEQVPAVKKLSTGNTVTVKAVCSGGIYSELLSSETISFKHAIITKQ